MPDAFRTTGTGGKLFGAYWNLLARLAGRFVSRFGVQGGTTWQHKACSHAGCPLLRAHTQKQAPIRRLLLLQPPYAAAAAPPPESGTSRS